MWGVNVSVLTNSIHISPVFFLESLKACKDFIKWLEGHFVNIKKEAEAVTKHGQLLKIENKIVGRKVFSRFCYKTGDAMGMNMINIMTENACKYISNETGIRHLIRSGYSSDKKMSALGFIKGYGKEVFAEAVIPKECLRLLNVTPEDLQEWYHTTMLSGLHAGMVGMNGQIANGISAIFTATGQDIAHIIHSCAGISQCEILKSGDLYGSVYLPNLLIGTVGGGTNLPTQRECLEIMGCYGSNKSLKLAEIIGGTILAGELAISASIINGSFVQAHKDLRKNK